MSVSTPPPPGPIPLEPVEERCPLCGGPLGAEQEWCLRCGAAARTRLAATPRWRPPVIALTTVIVLSLGALTAALVSLAGSSGAGGTVVTRTVTVPATGATTTPGAAAGAAGTTTGVPGVSTTGATGTTAPGTSTTGTTGATVPGTGTAGATRTTAPGTSTTGATVPKTGATATAPAGRTPAG